MKILLDQNISYKIPALLSNNFQHVAQVRQLGLENADDREIWRYAHQNEFIIVTFDSDFIDLVHLKGALPKIIWLKFGNVSNLKW